MAGLRALACACSMALLNLASSFSLTVLHVNDHHSHLQGERMTLPGGQLGFSSNVRVSYGGYPRLVSAFEQLKSLAEANGDAVLKLHAGDAITGTVYYSLFKGKADAEMMARVCYDALALGNHEFDDGDQPLADFLDSLQNHSSICARTPVLAANLVPGPSSPLAGKVSKSHTVTLAGQRIGIVGIDIMLKTMQTSSPSHGTTLTDERAAAQAEINRLLADGVNKIILLTHIGYGLDRAWMAALSGVDVVIGGDSHTLLGDSNTTAAGFHVKGAYPTTMTNGDGKTVCVVHAWEYAKAIGNLRVKFDASGDVTSCGGAPRFAYDDSDMVFRDSASTPLTQAERATAADYLNSLGGQWMPALEDPEALSALMVYEKQAASLQQMRIAGVPKAICYDRFPGQGRSTICLPEATREHGGGVCQLVAKAFLAVTKSADIAIQNAGGCRTDIDPGNFTNDDAYTMLPFSNTLVTLVLTGTQIKDVLEDALDFALDARASTGGYPYASGIRFAVDASERYGSRINRLQVNARLAGSWVAIDGAAAYTIVTNSYIAKGRDGYATFTQASRSVNTYVEDAEGLVRYAREVRTLAEPPTEEFSTQAYTSRDGVVHSTWPSSSPHLRDQAASASPGAEGRSGSAFLSAAYPTAARALLPVSTLAMFIAAAATW